MKHEVAKLFQIVEKKKLNDAVTMVRIAAPLIAKKVLPGQFIIFRLDEFGERVPLTVADYDREGGTITLIFQAAGESTRQFAALEAGDAILDLVGPLGVPTELPEGTKSVCVIGGGVGCAIAYPQAKHLHSLGLQVDTIVGFRNKDIVILEDEFRACSDNLYVCTDDGSYGTKGFVTNVLKEQLDEVLDTLTEREQKVLRLRFGMNDGRARTLEEVGREFDVTRERIRQIEAKALRKLRHPSRSRKLRDYLD